jgi:hypothetical protein
LPSLPPASHDSGAYSPAHTLTASAHTASGATAERRGPKTAVVMAVAGALLAVAAGVGWEMRPKAVASTPPVPTVTAAAASPARSESPAAAESPKPVEQGPDSRAAPDVAASTPQVGPAPTTVRVAAPAPRPSSQLRVPTAGAAPSARVGSAAPAATSNCRVVSYFDVNGNQHFKQQCGN